MAKYLGNVAGVLKTSDCGIVVCHLVRAQTGCERVWSLTEPVLQHSVTKKA